MATNPTMSKKAELFLFALQNTFGSAMPSLTNADHADVDGASLLDNEQTSHEIDETSGSFNQPANVQGDMPGNVSANYRLRSWGQSNSPNVLRAFQCSGMKLATVSDVHTLTQTSLRSEWKDGTMWHYSGNKDTSGSLLEKCGNIMYDFEIKMPIGGVPMASFTGVGQHQGAAINATQPSVTRNTQTTNALIGVTFSLNGIAYKCIEFAIQANHTPENTIDQLATYGRGDTLMVDKKVKWTAKVYAVTTGNGDPFASMLAGTLATTSIAWGSNPNGWTIASGASKSQITSRKKSEQNNVDAWDLEGLFVDNDFSIELDAS